MTNRQRLLCLPPIMLLVLAAFALAGDGASGIGTGRLETTADCQIGNLNDPVGAPVPDIFTGDESYAYHVFPTDQCGCSEGGFSVESVSQLLYFDAVGLPVTLQVEARLLAAVQDPTLLCWLPGPERCLGPIVTITIDTPGYHLVTAPVLGCPMQPFEDHYFLSLKYLGGAPAYLAIDDQPAACTEYIDRGDGWEDLFLFGKTGGGKSIIFGDIVCGALSVDAEPDAWGSIKSLFR